MLQITPWVTLLTVQIILRTVVVQELSYAHATTCKSLLHGSRWSKPYPMSRQLTGEIVGIVRTQVGVGGCGNNIVSVGNAWRISEYGWLQGVRHG